MVSPWRTSTTSTVGVRGYWGSVTQADPQIPRGVDRVRVERNVLGPADDVLERHAGDVLPVEPNHGAERPVVDGPHRRRAEAEGEQPVVRRGRAAAARRRSLSQTFEMSNGISGSRMTSALPEIPFDISKVCDKIRRCRTGS